MTLEAEKMKKLILIITMMISLAAYGEELKVISHQDANYEGVLSGILFNFNDDSWVMVSQESEGGDSLSEIFENTIYAWEDNDFDTVENGDNYTVFYSMETEEQGLVQLFDNYVVSVYFGGDSEADDLKDALLDYVDNNKI